MCVKIIIFVKKFLTNTKYKMILKTLANFSRYKVCIKKRYVQSTYNPLTSKTNSFTTTPLLFTEFYVHELSWNDRTNTPLQPETRKQIHRFAERTNFTGYERIGHRCAFRVCLLSDLSGSIWFLSQKHEPKKPGRSSICRDFLAWTQHIVGLTQNGLIRT